MIVLDEGTVAAVRRHLELQDVERRRAVGLWETRGTSSSVRTASRSTPTAPSHLLGVMSIAAGVPRIRLHDLCHTAAPLALGAGVHPKVVSERLGHSSIAITLDTYSHVLPSMQEDAAAKLGSILDAEASTD